MNSKAGKIAFLLSLICLIAIEIKYLFQTPLSYGFPGSIDFIQYWSSNNISNPYDAAQMLSAQRQLGFLGANPIMMWVAPWVLIILKPFLIWNFEISFLAFLFFNISALLFCSYLLQITYSKDKSFNYKTCLLALCFFPAWDCINFGQISIVLLLALSAANYFLNKEKPLAASLCFSVMSIKPHLFIYLALMTLFWAIQNKKYKLLISTLASSCTLIILSYFQKPELLSNWLNSMLNYGTAGSVRTSEWAPATIGTWLRVALGIEQLYLIWLPTLFAIIFLFYQIFTKRFLNKEYKTLLPLALSVSLLSAPYAWLYDQSLFLICQVFIFYADPKTIRNNALRNLALIQIIYLLLKVTPQTAQQHFAILLPIWFIYLAGVSTSGETSSAASSSSGEKSSTACCFLF